MQLNLLYKKKLGQPLEGSYQHYFYIHLLFNPIKSSSKILGEISAYIWVEGRINEKKNCPSVILTKNKIYFQELFCSLCRWYLHGMSHRHSAIHVSLRKNGENQLEGHFDSSVDFVVKYPVVHVGHRFN